MPIHASKLVSYSCVLIVSLVTPAFAEEPKLNSALNLTRGHFQHAVFNQDETQLLTATNELAQLWDLNTGALIQQFEGHGASIHSLCFSADGQQILTGAGKAVVHGADDPTARLWDVSSGKQLAVLTTWGEDLVDQIGTSGSYIVFKAVFSPDGQRILAVFDSSTSRPDAAVLWKLPGKEIDFVLSRISTNSGSNVIDEPVRFSPNGKWLFGFVNKATQVVIWNAESGEVRNRFSASDPSDAKDVRIRFEQLQWSPSGKLLLAVLSDRTVRIWDISTGKESQRITGHDKAIREARFFAKGSQILTASQDQTVRLWNIDSGKQIRQWNYPDSVQEMDVTPDDKALLTRTVRPGETYFRNQWFGELRNVQSGETIRQWELPPMWIAELQPLNAFRSSIMSPSGRLVLTPAWVNGQVEVNLVDANTGAIRKKY